MTKNTKADLAAALKEFAHHTTKTPEQRAIIAIAELALEKPEVPASKAKAAK